MSIYSPDYYPGADDDPDDDEELDSDPWAGQFDQPDTDRNTELDAADRAAHIPVGDM